MKPHFRFLQAGGVALAGLSKKSRAVIVTVLLGSSLSACLGTGEFSYVNSLTSDDEDESVGSGSGSGSGSGAVDDGGGVVDTSVHFSRDLQPLFDHPLTNGTTSNNVACVFCHSPAVPITGSATVATACNAVADGSSTDCHGRGDVALYASPANSSAAGAAIASYSKVSSNASVTRLWNSAATASAGGLTTFPKGGVATAFANGFTPTLAGYVFDCTKVKDLLTYTTTAQTTVATDPTLSALYLRLSQASGTGMPRHKPSSTASGGGAYTTPTTDAQLNSVTWNADQLALLVRWFNEGADCTK